jgi:hypothetical protein
VPYTVGITEQSQYTCVSIVDPTAASEFTTCSAAPVLRARDSLVLTAAVALLMSLLL